jgi:hypothetical protein
MAADLTLHYEPNRVLSARTPGVFRYVTAESCKGAIRRGETWFDINVAFLPEHMREVAEMNVKLAVKISYAPMKCHAQGIPKEWFRVSSIVLLFMHCCGLEYVPDDIICLHNLLVLGLTSNPLKRISGAIGRLPKLYLIELQFTNLGEIPSTLKRPSLHGLDPTRRGDAIVREIRERTIDRLSVFAYEFTDVCFGLQDLDLPALVTLEILDALCPNAVRMAAKWDLIVAVKHFRR